MEFSRQAQKSICMLQNISLRCIFFFIVYNIPPVAVYNKMAQAAQVSLNCGCVYLFFLYTFFYSFDRNTQ